MAGEAKEKCAVAGVLIGGDDAEVDASILTYETLITQQHRGQEASGIISQAADSRLHSQREHGLVVDVYSEEAIRRLAGKLAIGHNRYSTSGSTNSHRQPFLDEAVGLGFSFNGNIPDTTALEDYLNAHGIRNSNANDTEMVGYALSQYLREGYDLPTAVEHAYPLFTGAFSCVALHDGALVAFRDECGIRPLALGQDGDTYAVTSETCGLDTIGIPYLREVEPGEMIIISEDGIETRQLAEGKHKLDIFEVVYFARHDSRLYGKSVNVLRRELGKQLAVEHPPIQDNLDNIVVVPVPDTSIPIAEGYSQALGLTQHQAIIKNRYIGRTFINPKQAVRERDLKWKHNIVPEDVVGKDVILIDDSIVRQNTMPVLVELASTSGARSITVLVGSPPVRFPDFYGIDTPSQSELPAANLTIGQMKDRIGNDGACKHLGFLSLEGMIQATGIPADKFNLSCFNGEYPIDIGKRRREIRTPVSMEGIE